MQNFSTNESGFTTSIAMTPIKGIELGNPELVKKETNEKYFSFVKRKLDQEH
jgi:hypothetical protein